MMCLTSKKSNITITIIALLLIGNSYTKSEERSAGRPNEKNSEKKDKPFKLILKSLSLVENEGTPQEKVIFEQKFDQNPKKSKGKRPTQTKILFDFNFDKLDNKESVDL